MAASSPAGVGDLREGGGEGGGSGWIRVRGGEVV